MLLGDVHFVNIEDSQNMDQLFKYQDPVETPNGKIEAVPSTKFRIPELPTGRRLTINILSSW